MASNRPRLISLKDKQDFDRLRTHGRVIFPNSWMIVSFAPNQFGKMRCGWTFPKYVGSAVVRNRFKRWSREFFREYIRRRNHLGLDINVILRRRPQDFYKNMEHEEFVSALQTASKRLRV